MKHLLIEQEELLKTIWEIFLGVGMDLHITFAPVIKILITGTLIGGNAYHMIEANVWPQFDELTTVNQQYCVAGVGAVGDEELSTFSIAPGLFACRLTQNLVCQWPIFDKVSYFHLVRFLLGYLPAFVLIMVKIARLHTVKGLPTFLLKLSQPGQGPSGLHFYPCQRIRQRWDIWD